jgi:hypothetical protein
MLNLNEETYSCCNLSFNICVYMADLKTHTYILLELQQEPIPNISN